MGSDHLREVRKFMPVLVLLLAIGALNPLSASLIFQSSVVLQGTGLGTTNTILTIQNSPSESGCVAWSASGQRIGPAQGACPAGVTGGDEKTGASQTQVRTVSTLGILSASDVALVFNPNEGSGDAITLSQMVLRVWSPSGTLLYTVSLAAPQLVTDTGGGTGHAGFIFRLEWDQAHDPLAIAAFSNGTNYVGLAATAADTSQSGNEVFFGASAAGLGVPDVPVPEPASFGMMAAGLGGIVLLLRRDARA